MGSVLDRSQGYYKRDSVEVMGRRRTVWIEDGYRLPREGNLLHALAVRLNHARALRAGFIDWTYSSHGLAKEAEVYPDAVAQDPAGRLLAIEVERSVKADYTRPVGNRLLARSKQGWTACLYLCPTRQIAEIVRRRIAAIQGLPIKPDGTLGTERDEGVELHLLTAEQRAWFKIHTYDDWPALGGLSRGPSSEGFLGGSEVDGSTAEQ
jgi:hypothetical protein